MAKDSLVINSKITVLIEGASSIAQDFIINSKIITQLNLSSFIGIEAADFSPQFQAVYDNWTIKPPFNVAIQMDIMVRGWVVTGVWDKKDRIFVFAVHTNVNGEALDDWKNPGVNFATIVNNPIHTPYEGFTSDGSTQYIDSNYNPFIHGVNYTLNDAGVSAYIRSNVNTGYLLGALSNAPTTWTYLIPRLSGLSFVRLNSIDVDVSTASDSGGQYHTNRPNSVNVNMYRNYVKIIDDANNSLSIVDANMAILAFNIAGTISNFFPGQVSQTSFGASLTEQEVTDETSYLENYMISNGKGFI